jgi:hypothetical protein
VLDKNFILCQIETSDKTAVGSSGVPFRRLAKPEGTHPQGALFFLRQINIIVFNFTLKNINPFHVVSFVFPENSPGKQIDCLKRQVFMR